MRRKFGMLMGWTAPGVGLLMFALVGCDSKETPSPPASRLVSAAPAETVEVREDRMSHLEAGESGNDRSTTRAESDPILAEARSKSAGFSQGLLQMESPEIRERTLEEVAVALGSEVEAEVLAGLQSLGAIAQLDVDHSRFRELVLPLLDSASPKVRAGAIAGLLATKPEPGDLARLLPMVEDESLEVRAALPFAIKTLSQGDLTGEAAPAILRLLDSVKGPEHRMFLSALSGSSYSPELETRLVELATPLGRDTAYDAMYYSLSTQQNKGEGTIDVLISCLSYPDQVNVVQRALWGMGFGVAETQRERVADAVLDFFTIRTGHRDQTLRVLGQYGVEKHALALSQYAEKPGLPKDLRDAVINTVAGIRARQ